MIGFGDFLANLGEQVSARMSRLRIPGVAVAVVRGAERHAVGYGVTNVEHPLPVDADTLFSIASITKVFTATARMRLLPAAPPLSSLPATLGGDGGFGEGQRLDLDAPVRTYLPDFRLADDDAAARVTVRHLLTHTGGWVGWAMNWAGPRDYARDAIERALPRMDRLPQLAAPGALFSYSNNGYVVAGRVLEVLTRRAFDTAAARLVLEPLGMARASFFGRSTISHRVAVGHSNAGGTAVVDRSQPYGLNPVFNPSGGLAAIANEMLSFAEFHLGDGMAPDGTRLLTGELLAAMQTSNVRVDCAGTGYGLGWFVRDIGGVRVLAHNGYIGTSICYLTLVPSRHFGIAVLTNAGPNRLDIEITNWALEHGIGLVSRPAEARRVPDEALREYAGRYEGVVRLFDLDLAVADGGLAIRRVPKGAGSGSATVTEAALPERFVFCGEDCVVRAGDLAGARSDFLRGTAGEIKWFRHSRGLYPRIG